MPSHQPLLLVRRSVPSWPVLNGAPSSCFSHARANPSCTSKTPRPQIPLKSCMMYARLAEISPRLVFFTRFVLICWRWPRLRWLLPGAEKRLSAATSHQNYELSSTKGEGDLLFAFSYNRTTVTASQRNRADAEEVITRTRGARGFCGAARASQIPKRSRESSQE